MSYTFTNKTKEPIPKHPFKEMKEAVLGKEYELSFVIIDEQEMQALNYAHRKIDKPTDILSFPLSEKLGEIFICPSESRKEAKKFDREYDNFIAFLFIHGLVHLKGFDHGSTMENNERKIREEFGI
jgi:probable rRNA maturation factor